MRERTKVDYAARIGRVVKHIADNLDAPLDLDRLAEVGCFSRWHFHRIYRGVMGETSDQTVRRLRLHRAAAALALTDAPMARLATQAGYGSIEAFSRAFTAAYGRSPSTYRAERLGPPNGDTGHPRGVGDRPMSDVVVETAPARTLIGLPHRGSYQDIGGPFAQLYAWAAPRGLMRADTEVIALYYDDPDSVAVTELRSFAGVTIPPGTDADALIEAPFEVTRLIGGEVARTTHKGPYSDLPTTYRKMYADWLPHSGREPADAPAFEVYRNNPQDTPPDALLTDICVPLAAVAG